MQHRYLTKSRFKFGMECPTKLYYTGKRAEYADQSLDDPFLEALADGGFQVGELARQYYPWGHDIKTLDYAEALEQTRALLQQHTVTIYEAAIRFKNLFIRADILRKNGNRVELIEVKSKSFNASEDLPFLNKKGNLVPAWKPYLYDIAFQTYVLTNAYPDYEVHPLLMLADKSALCPTNGLHQKFRIRKSDDNRKYVILKDELSKEDLTVPILKAVDVSSLTTMIGEGLGSDDFQPKGFEGTIEWLAAHYEHDEKIKPVPGSYCRECSFWATPKEVRRGVKDGFRECWTEAFGWNDPDFQQPNLFALWDYRKKDDAMAVGKLKLVDLDEEDLGLKDDDRPGLSRTARQLLQIEKAKQEDVTPYFDKAGMTREMETWRFPLHFIDFETSITPIPFTKGRRPYEMVAFQFSHHTVEENGQVRHAGQYLCTEQGSFPNIDFIRALKTALEADHGTIFRYSFHENTVLLAIYEQLAESDLGHEERHELMDFIISITQAKEKNGYAWVGPRNMVDLCYLVKRYYFDPYTNGSNSIKYVLPAVLNSSTYLQERYSKPIYGTKKGVESLNFKDWTWVERDIDGKVRDPYALLPAMFSDVTDKSSEFLLSDRDEGIRNGGAAMTAYARLQYEEMSDFERQRIVDSLLKYCELDTLAMVVIYEAWREWCNGNR